MKRPWIPAFAGMTSKSNGKMDSSFRWNDGDVAHRCRSARMLRAWNPAFAGMTVRLKPSRECPDATALCPGFLRDDARRPRQTRSALQTRQIDHEPVPHVRLQHALVRLVDLVHADHFDI